MGEKILWSDLDLEFVKRILDLELSPAWSLIANSMATNFLYSIRSLIHDAKNSGGVSFNGNLAPNYP